MLPKTRLLFLIRFPLERTIVKPVCPKEWVVIPPDEQTPLILMCVRGNNTELSPHILSLDTAQRTLTPHFVKFPGENIKQEVEGEVQHWVEGYRADILCPESPQVQGKCWVVEHEQLAWRFRCKKWEGPGLSFLWGFGKEELIPHVQKLQTALAGRSTVARAGQRTTLRASSGVGLLSGVLSSMPSLSCCHPWGSPWWVSSWGGGGRGVQ